MKDTNLNIRLSKLDRKNIKDKAKYFGISQSKLIVIMSAIVKDDDIMQYLLDKIQSK